MKCRFRDLLLQIWKRVIKKCHRLCWPFLEIHFNYKLIKSGIWTTSSKKFSTTCSEYDVFQQPVQERSVSKSIFRDHFFEIHFRDTASRAQQHVQNTIPSDMLEWAVSKSIFIPWKYISWQALRSVEHRSNNKFRKRRFPTPSDMLEWAVLKSIFINYRGRHHEYKTNKQILDTKTYADCQPKHTNPRTFHAMVTHPVSINVLTGEDVNSIV